MFIFIFLDKMYVLSCHVLNVYFHLQNQNQNQNHLFDKKYIHFEAHSCNCYSSHRETTTKEKTISANVVATS